MNVNRKFYIGGFVVLTAIAYLSYVGFNSGATYYYTVSELTQIESPITSESVRVSGSIVPDSVREEVTTRTLRFVITDGTDSLPVTYQGIVPDSFISDSEVVVEGHLDSDGIFQASGILTKCPSKYEPSN